MEALTKDQGLKATAWIQTTLFDQQRRMYMYIKRQRCFDIQARGISLKICLSTLGSGWGNIYNQRLLTPLFLALMVIFCPISNLRMLPEFHNLNQSIWVGIPKFLLVCSLLFYQNCSFFFFLVKKLMEGTWLSLFLSHLIANYKVYLLAGKARSVLILQTKEMNDHL